MRIYETASEGPNSHIHLKDRGWTAKRILLVGDGYAAPKFAKQISGVDLTVERSMHRVLGLDSGA